MEPVECGMCRATVLVRKTSRSHTSVQWTDGARRTCLEFEPFNGEPMARSSTCFALRDSIERAVHTGALTIHPTEHIA